MSKNNVLLLHGALGSSAQMTELAQLLSDDFNIYSFDFQGHGGQPLPPNGLSIHALTDQLADFIKTHHLNGASIFGYSMGGYVALNLAMRHNPLASPGTIITLGTKFDWSPDSASREAAHMNPDKWEAKIPHFAEMLRHRHAPQDWKHLVQATAEMMLALGNGDAFDYADLAQVQQAVCIMVGELDQMVSQEEGRLAAQHLANGRFASLPQVKHPFEQLDPAGLAHHIKQALIVAPPMDGRIMGSLFLNLIL